MKYIAYAHIRRAMRSGRVTVAVLATAALLGLAGCPPADGGRGRTSGGAGQSTAGEPLRVVCTTGLAADMVRSVGGSRVDVAALMGPGVDPHLYRASEGDVAKLAEADLVVYHGLHLEAKLADLLEELGERRAVHALCDHLDPAELLDWEGGGANYDPHVWFDVTLWAGCIGPLEQRLAELAPDGAADFAAQAETYGAELEALDAEVRAQVETVPTELRVLVTAHDAFRYFGRAYGFEVVGLQGISTEAQAGTADVRRLADFIAQRRIPAIFVESSVPRRNVEAVQAAVRSRGHTVEVGGELYSDALGDPGSAAGTYAGMVRHNVEAIVGALKNK